MVYWVKHFSCKLEGLSWDPKHPSKCPVSIVANLSSQHPGGERGIPVVYRLIRLTELARSTLKQETLPRYVRWNMCKEEHSIWLLRAQIHVQICAYTHVNICMLPSHVHMSMQNKKKLKFSVIVSQVYAPLDSPNEL